MSMTTPFFKVHSYGTAPKAVEAVPVVNVDSDSEKKRSVHPVQMPLVCKATKFAGGFVLQAGNEEPMGSPALGSCSVLFRYYATAQQRMQRLCSIVLG